MRIINSAKIDLPGINRLSREFELGDLTIFIGRSNSGKSRILTNIFDQVNQANNQIFAQDVKHFKSLKDTKLTFSTYKKKNIKVEYITSPRGKITNINGLGTKLANCCQSLQQIDPTISDFGNNVILFSNDKQRSLSEQGTGIHQQVHISDKIYEKNDLLLIDEPEISQYPTGKIELLNQIITSLSSKQILLATHDPTIINQYIIKKIQGKKRYKIILYSFCSNQFKKIDFNTTINPETHVGYLSQTFSGKPVHLVFEGQTELYAFQALLTKYCIHNNIEDYPKLLANINLSQLQGSQWKINIFQLPDVRYYDTFIILDGEHARDLNTFDFSSSTNKINIVRTFRGVKEGQINVYSLKSENIEVIEKNLFDETYPKPIGFAKKIWSLTEDEFNEIDFSKGDLANIKKIFDWALSKAGLIIKKPGKKKKLTHEQIWDNHLLDYKKFKDKFNREPSRDGNEKEKFLSYWIRDQRRYYRDGILSSERIKKLMRIKFDFNPEKRIGRKKGDSDRGLRDRTGYFGNKNARKNK